MRQSTVLLDAVLYAVLRNYSESEVIRVIAPIQIHQGMKHRSRKHQLRADCDSMFNSGCGF